MLRFSANLSLLFTELPLLRRFEAAKRHGFEAVEIQFPYALPAEQIQAELDNSQLKLVLFNVDADTLLQGGEGLAAVPEKQAQFREAVEHKTVPGTAGHVLGAEYPDRHIRDDFRVYGLVIRTDDYIFLRFDLRSDREFLILDADAVYRGEACGSNGHVIQPPDYRLRFLRPPRYIRRREFASL